MKPQLNKYAIAIMLLISISGYSQHSEVENIYFNSTTFTTIDLTSKKLVGTSYIKDKFLPGKISNQKMVYSMRYNAYLDKMEVELDNKAYYLPLSSNYSIAFESLNKIYQVLDYKEKELTSKGFFVVEYLGNEISLFLKEKIKLYEEVPAKLGFTPYEPPKLGRLNDKLYVGYKNNTAIELPNNKKDILKLFSTKSNEIESYAKKNNLGFKSKEDLIQIFRYYNTLK